MALGDRIKARREELSLTRPQLADRLGVTPAAVGNYETGISFPKEEILLRLFDCLEIDPNTLFQDSFRHGRSVLTQKERQLLEQYRSLSSAGREGISAVLKTLLAYQAELERPAPERESRVIPCTGRRQLPAMRRRYSERILTTWRSPMRSRRQRSSPCASRVTPWCPTLPTGTWSM